MWPCPRLSTDILSTRFSPPRMFSSSVTRARMCDTFVYLLPRPCCSRIDRFQVSTLGGWKASRGNRSSNPPLGELLPLHGLIIFSTSRGGATVTKEKKKKKDFHALVTDCYVFTRFSVALRLRIWLRGFSWISSFTRGNWNWSVRAFNESECRDIIMRSCYIREEETSRRERGKEKIIKTKFFLADVIHGGQKILKSRDVQKRRSRVYYVTIRQTDAYANFARLQLAVSWTRVGRGVVLDLSDLLAFSAVFIIKIRSMVKGKKIALAEFQIRARK